MAKKILFMADVRENASFSSEKTISDAKFSYIKKSYGKKSCLNTILKWEKSYHFSLTSNFELAESFFPQDAYYGKSST